MPKQTINRRKALQFLGVAATMPVIRQVQTNVPKTFESKNPGFTFCLNMATIRGHQLGLVKELETASKAGFRSVEIWIDTLQDYLKTGKTIKDVAKLLDSLGLKVENLISFAQWIVDDAATRKQGIEQMQTEMGLMAEIGCKRIAATGKGLGNESTMSLDVIASRYRAILELGDKTGVVPQLEMWGFMKKLSRVSEVTYIAMESSHPSAKILLDIFHLYKGGTSLDELALLNPSAVDILHMNDYPAKLAANVIEDSDRIYPGDGVAPIKRTLQMLGNANRSLVLSTEVFNKEYYQQDALIVAKTALDKMKRIVESI